VPPLLLSPLLMRRKRGREEGVGKGHRGMVNDERCITALLCPVSV